MVKLSCDLPPFFMGTGLSRLCFRRGDLLGFGQGVRYAVVETTD